MTSQARCHGNVSTATATLPMAAACNNARTLSIPSPVPPKTLKEKLKTHSDKLMTAQL